MLYYIQQQRYTKLLPITHFIYNYLIKCKVFYINSESININDIINLQER